MGGQPIPALRQTLSLLLLCLTGVACGQVRFPPPVVQTRSNVFVRTESAADPVVASVVARDLTTMLARLPNGEFATMPISRGVPTDRPYKPAPVAEMIKQLQREFPHFKVNLVGRYIYVYNTPDEFRDFANKVLIETTTTVDRFFAKHQLGNRKPTHPLVVVLYATDIQMAQGRPRGEQLATTARPIIACMRSSREYRTSRHTLRECVANRRSLTRVCTSCYTTRGFTNGFRLAQRGLLKELPITSCRAVLVIFARQQTRTTIVLQNSFLSAPRGAVRL